MKDQLNKESKADLFKEISYPIFANLREGILIADIKTKKFVLANSSICKMLGYSHDELLKLKVTDIHPKKDLPYVLCRFKEQVEGKEKLAEALPILRKNGFIFYCDVIASPIVLRGKKYLAGTFINITYRKKAEEELKREKERAEKYLKIAGVLIVALDKDGKIILINKKGNEILGYNNGDLIGKSWFNTCLPKEDRESVKNVFCKLMRKEVKNTEHYENYVITKKGEKRLINWYNSLVIDDKGSVIGTISSGEDITEKRKAEEELKKLKEDLEIKVKDRTIKLENAYEDLKELEVMKSNFLTIVSHELKTPLTPAKLQLQMLKDGSLGELNEKQKVSFDVILRNVNRLNKLIGDILEISRMQAGTFKMNPEEFSISDLIKEVYYNLVQMSESKGLKLSFKFEENLPLVYADRIRIGEVITNLIDNAIKFSNKGEIQIDAKKDKENILVKVRDSGIGIKKEEERYIFVPFFQAEPLYTRKHGGIGLGLSICKKIVEQHGGKIWFESKVRKGTSFYFTIPINHKTKNLKVSENK